MHFYNILSKWTLLLNKSVDKQYVPVICNQKELLTQEFLHMKEYNCVHLCFVLWSVIYFLDDKRKNKFGWFYDSCLTVDPWKQPKGCLKVLG